MVLGAEAPLPVIAIRGKVQPQPVLAADDRGWEAGSGEPVGTGKGPGQEPRVVETGGWASRNLPSSPACEGLCLGLGQEGKTGVAQPPSSSLGREQLEGAPPGALLTAGFP